MYKRLWIRNLSKYLFWFIDLYLLLFAYEKAVSKKSFSNYLSANHPRKSRGKILLSDKIFSRSRPEATPFLYRVSCGFLLTSSLIFATGIPRERKWVACRGGYSFHWVSEDVWTCSLHLLFPTKTLSGSRFRDCNLNSSVPWSYLLFLVPLKDKSRFN